MSLVSERDVGVRPLEGGATTGCRQEPHHKAPLAEKEGGDPV